MFIVLVLDYVATEVSDRQLATDTISIKLVYGNVNGHGGGNGSVESPN